MKGLAISLLFGVLIITYPLFAQQNQDQQKLGQEIETLKKQIEDVKSNHTGITTGTIIAIIALVIVVIGWIVTHILSIRAQNRNFVNQVKNSARLEIVDSIKKYQYWLIEAETALLSLNTKVALQECNLQVDWVKTRIELIEIFHTLHPSDASRWMHLLEAYEILFPKTREARIFLIEQDGKVGEFLNECFNKLGTWSNFCELKRIVEEIGKDSLEILGNQTALIGDLLVYLQNVCLSSFTHYEIPERVPQDLSLPRLISDKKGNIKIIGEIKIPSQNEQ